MKTVLSISPRYSGEKPPADADPLNDLFEGRAEIGSDRYFNLGLPRSSISLLDTGIRSSHTVFNNPSNIGVQRDCINGGADCNTGVLDLADYWDHGTKTASILCGNSNLGQRFRGVTDFTVDSFKVYTPPPSPPGGLDHDAAVLAFQISRALLYNVIVAEMQDPGDDHSDLADAADRAFDAGAVVIAANGNSGPAPSTARCPANAHKVIGVGAFDVKNLVQYNPQSRGPAPDDRIKPDVQGPNMTEVASNASDTATTTFDGTSGATPYVGGAAALLRSWIISVTSAGGVDPGQVYAFLILSGQVPHPFDNTTGAGPIIMPPDGFSWWGSTPISNGDTVDIPLTLTGSTINTLDGALWWPEAMDQEHNDIDLYLIDPNGTIQASSLDVHSVFERARVNGPVSTGEWTLRIRGENVSSGSQNVYFASHVSI